MAGSPSSAPEWEEPPRQLIPDIRVFLNHPSVHSLRLQFVRLQLIPHEHVTTYLPPEVTYHSNRVVYIFVTGYDVAEVQAFELSRLVVGGRIGFG